jgi:hypothetical protein
MILMKRRPELGTWFAWRPVFTPDGLVWRERVSFEWIDGTVHYKRLPGRGRHESHPLDQ